MKIVISKLFEFRAEEDNSILWKQLSECNMMYTDFRSQNEILNIMANTILGTSEMEALNRRISFCAM